MSRKRKEIKKEKKNQDKEKKKKKIKRKCQVPELNKEHVNHSRHLTRR